MTRLTDTFPQARDRIRRLQAAETADPLINPDCRSILLDHGQATRRAVVFLHGITSSPVQFRDLGSLFHSRGYNVLVPRLPRHGYRDRLTRDQGRLNRAELVAFAGQAVDLGRGLGEHLTVAGLSVSGVLAAWCAQRRRQVDLAVLIAPAFAPAGVPMALVPALARLVRAIPDSFIWWDPRRGARLGPECSYPRFSTHAMAESFLLAAELYGEAKHRPPAGKAILTVTNPRDPAVNNAATRAAVRRWRAHHTTAVQEYGFSPGLGRLHDVIGPYQPNARVDQVYPILLDLIDAAAAVGAA